MKLTNLQIRVVNNAYLNLSQKEIPCFIPVCVNIVELEPHVKKIESFLVKVAEKNGWMNETKTGFIVPTDKIGDWENQTKKFLETVVEVKLDVIKRKELESPDVKIPASLIVELFKLKLIV